MIAVVRFDRSHGFAKDKPARAMTPREIQNGLRKRKYSWGKSTTELAAEIGVSTETVNAAILGKPISEFSIAKIVVYLQVPMGPAGLVRNRGKNAKPQSERHFLVRRIVRLAMLARQYGIYSRKREMLKEYSNGQLRSYFWNLDARLKQELIKRHQLLASRFLLSDSMDAWEWIERLEKLGQVKPNERANAGRNK